jgi:glutamyl-tRNA synthetase
MDSRSSNSFDSLPRQLISRFAPSPTGGQHLGNARTYLINWLVARSCGGKILFRVEDLDTPRIKPEAIPQLESDLSWLGLDWDESPIIQTGRITLYEEALQRLQAKELVYPCVCTRTDILNAASAPHLEHEGPAYPGTCRNLRVSDADLIIGKPFAWRFRVTNSPTWHDRFLGPQNVDIRQIGGDFVVWRSNRVPAYQLAVVVDDADQGVNLVVRGDDLVPSTPRQLLLYDTLAMTAPEFMHLPLVKGPDGMRLAKRHGEARIAMFRQQGVTSEKIIGFLAWSCGWLKDLKPISAKELLSFFDLNTIPREPFVLLPWHLEWLKSGSRPEQE